MHNSFSPSGEDPREESALRGILRLAELDDGSGFVLGELEATLGALDPDIRTRPSVRVASEPFLAELKLGLGYDGHVIGLLYAAVDDAIAGDPAARVVALRTLRALCRMDAVELGDVVNRLRERAEGTDPGLAVGLDLAAAVLDAVGPGAHPLAYPRLPGRFADRILMAGDPELLCFFADVEIAVHEREKTDRTIAGELELERELEREAGPDDGNANANAGADTGTGTDRGRGCGSRRPRRDRPTAPGTGDFGDAQHGV
ncbi:hypothetical protein FOB82_07130 [Corynebacterium xerosis]|uniref:Uncharacterized protein n=1 Tax=Corynebacterium xerosis TaxID=1725 RepID=A0A6B8TGK9_9CORY|nr:hypothetical protein [Corynebacterium xerosis]QGS34754.1 hypothetical protein FOB82_07130 [Corynebacterium xerosis]